MEDLRDEAMVIMSSNRVINEARRTLALSLSPASNECFCEEVRLAVAEGCGRSSIDGFHRVSRVQASSLFVGRVSVFVGGWLQQMIRRGKFRTIIWLTEVQVKFAKQQVK